MRTREPVGSRIDRLRDIELFADLDDDQLDWVARIGEEIRLDDGDVLFEDGQPAERFYVLLEGELLITKVLDGRVQVLSRHVCAPEQDDTLRSPKQDDKPAAAHRFTGELPLLVGGTNVARASAVGQAVLLAYGKADFLEMIVRCPQVCRVLLPVLAWRIHAMESQHSRGAMLEGLGTLTAGLAHELNNPATAVVRGAAELGAAVDELAALAGRWGGLAGAAEADRLDALTRRIAEGVTSRPRDPLEAEDEAELIADWLTDRQVPDARAAAALLADHGVTRDLIAELAAGMEPATLAVGVGHLAASLRARALVADVADAGRRITDLVAAAKAYPNTEQMPARQTDLIEGIESTLAMLAPKLADIQIVRDYADLPRVTAFPNELNQVWTNLIDNAVDAMDGHGELGIHTRVEDGMAVVQFRDTGPGIDRDILPLLFRPFFSTKDVGKGTGLGLHLSHNIVTVRHNGTIDVSAKPGDTRFTVRLPLDERRGCGPAPRS
jgi:signal transduction histidine kinase